MTQEPLINWLIVDKTHHLTYMDLWNLFFLTCCAVQKFGDFRQILYGENQVKPNKIPSVNISIMQLHTNASEKCETSVCNYSIGVLSKL